MFVTCMQFKNSKSATFVEFRKGNFGLNYCTLMYTVLKVAFAFWFLVFGGGMWGKSRTVN